MRNDQHRSRIFHQKILQPGDGFDVQMVGRLVEQDDARIAEQRLREQHLDLFFRGQARHLRIQNVRR